MSKQAFLSYVLYFTLCSLLLYLQWGLGLTPGVYVEPLFTPLYNGYELTVDAYRNTLSYLRSRNELIGRLHRLKKENRRLRQLAHEGKAAALENKQLRRYLKLPKAKEWSIKPAEILQRNLSGWEQTLRVHSVTDDRSVIVLSSDPRFKIGVQLEGIPGRQFVARGWGYRGLRIEQFPKFLPLDRGASVRSAPGSVMASRDYYVGEVTSIQSASRNDIGRRIRIRPPELTDRDIIWVVTGDE